MARPIRPVGAKTSTRTRIEKMITSVQRTAINWPPSALDQPDDEAADHRAGDAADAAQHRRGEGPQPGRVADDEAGVVVVEAEDQRRRAGQRRAEEKRGHDRPGRHRRPSSAPLRRPAPSPASPCRAGCVARTDAAPASAPAATPQISTSRSSRPRRPNCQRTAGIGLGKFYEPAPTVSRMMLNRM